MRRNLRNNNLRTLKHFNDLVKSGVVADLKFNNDGAILEHALCDRPTERDVDVIAKVISWSHENSIRTTCAWRTVPEARKLMKKMEVQLLQHALKGNFIFLRPEFEKLIVEGGNPFDQLGETDHPGLGENIVIILCEKLRDAEDVFNNLKKQLAYFRDYLRDKRMNEMDLLHDLFEDFSGILKVVLTKDGTVFRDYLFLNPPRNVRQHWVVELAPSGKITTLLTEEKLRK